MARKKSLKLLENLGLCGGVGLIGYANYLSRMNRAFSRPGFIAPAPIEIILIVLGCALFGLGYYCHGAAEKIGG